MTKDELIKEIALKSNIDKDDVLKVLEELEGISQDETSAASAVSDTGDSLAKADEAAVPAGSIVFACPDCGAVISALPASAGDDGECPFCKSKIKIPQKSVDAPTVGAVSAPEPKPELNAEGFVLFACRECGQEMECAASMAGLTAGCPACGSKIVIPAASTIESKSPASSDKSSADDDFSDISSSMTMRIDLMDL
jgi:DNA-directed RNA polymerase subunit RPC12/RpoP